MTARQEWLLRYRVDVVATSVAELVPFIGGWIFDQGMSGWDVEALVESPCADLRSAAILGAHVADLDGALAEPHSAPFPRALAVSAELYGRDPRVRDGVRRALDCRDISVLIWGDTDPLELQVPGGVTEYHCSAAGIAFKLQALNATTVRTPTSRLDDTETFMTLTIPAATPLLVGSNET